MTVQTMQVAPPNSLVLISDAQGGSVPDPEKIAQDAAITATNSCVVVCCLAEIDGETEITIGPTKEVGFADQPAFDGWLETPTHAIAVSTVEGKTLLETGVASDRTNLNIWTDRPNEPSRVIIGISA